MGRSKTLRASSSSSATAHKNKSTHASSYVARSTAHMNYHHHHHHEHHEHRATKTLKQKKAEWREKARATLTRLETTAKELKKTVEIVTMANEQIAVVRTAGKAVLVAQQAISSHARPVITVQQEVNKTSSRLITAVTARLGRQLYRKAFKQQRRPTAGAASANHGTGGGGGGDDVDNVDKLYGEFNHQYGALAQQFNVEATLDREWVVARETLRRETMLLYQMVQKACGEGSVDNVLQAYAEARTLIDECEALYEEADEADDDDSSNGEDEADVILKSRLEAAAATALLDAHQLAIDLQALNEKVATFEIKVSMSAVPKPPPPAAAAAPVPAVKRHEADNEHVGVQKKAKRDGADNDDADDAACTVAAGPEARLAHTAAAVAALAAAAAAAANGPVQ